MKITIHPWLSFLFVVAAALAAIQCGGHDDVCEGACECSGLECTCPDEGDCYVDCISDCALDCAGSGNCEFECGAACDVACTGSGECLVTVGDDSTVSCPGSGGCDVVCLGDCDVSCPGQGTCIVDCEPGFVCNLTDCSGSAESCPDDVQVCGGGCP
jgi:hypothetical protein